VDLFDLVKACFRRWYVVVPLLVLPAWFAHGAYVHVKPVYYSSAVISIAPPNSQVQFAEAGVAVPRNGLLEEGGGATLITNMAALALSDPSVQAQVVTAGGKPNYTAKMFPVSSSMAQIPLVLIEAEEPDPEPAFNTVGLVAAQAEPVVRALQQQAGVPDDQMVKAFAVSPPSAPAAEMPSRIKTTVAILAAGFGLAILAGVVVDLLILRWKARKRSRQEAYLRTVHRNVAETGESETTAGRRNTAAPKKHTTEGVVDAR
jgi:hypothetical protein